MLNIIEHVRCSLYMFAISERRILSSIYFLILLTELNNEQHYKLCI